MRDSAAAATLLRCLECGQGITMHLPHRFPLCAECATVICPHCRERYRHRDGSGDRCVCGERRR